VLLLLRSWTVTTRHAATGDLEGSWSPNLFSPKQTCPPPKN